MSRWVEQYETHEFRTTWTKVVEGVSAISSNKETASIERDEIARFKKTVKYIETLLSVLDPELIPETIWTGFQSHSDTCATQIISYLSNKNISYLKQANSSVDQLLTLVSPYVVSTGKAAKSANAAFNSYTKEIESALESFKSNANKIIEDLIGLKEQADNNLEVSTTSKDRINQLENDYFDDSEKESLSSKLSKLENKIEELYAKISEYSAELLEGDDANKSISSRISAAEETALEETKEIHEKLTDITSKVSEFRESTEMFSEWKVRTAWLRAV